ncbi:hypothetical protein H6P81_003917 [Aristolochia fimbriata]|uniref:Uncharacterized protein n=1 Tax=Aristolochia fimbriata TaxID=158543 RepID=A0AAV7FFS9_ARIFI|nr:hypothetical protein H6P81_003917 [Aristolochia fimbriata]
MGRGRSRGHLGPRRSAAHTVAITQNRSTCNMFRVPRPLRPTDCHLPLAAAAKLLISQSVSDAVTFVIPSRLPPSTGDGRAGGRAGGRRGRQDIQKRGWWDRVDPPLVSGAGQCGRDTFPFLSKSGPPQSFLFDPSFGCRIRRFSRSGSGGRECLSRTRFAHFARLISVPVPTSHDSRVSVGRWQAVAEAGRELSASRDENGGQGERFSRVKNEDEDGPGGRTQQ